jgi:hypothetical protein
VKRQLDWKYTVQMYIELRTHFTVAHFFFLFFAGSPLLSAETGPVYTTYSLHLETVPAVLQVMSRFSLVFKQ